MTDATQRILSLLILGAILIGIATAVSLTRLSSAERALERETIEAVATNKQIRTLREAQADYQKRVADDRKDTELRWKLGLPNPVEVRIVP